MTDELLCPFCGQELDYLSEDIYGSRVCPNCKCLGWVLHGNDSMWEELTTIKQKLDDLQKDYDLAVQHAKTMTETCLGYKNKLDDIKSDIDEMIAQSHDIGERFAEVVLCNLKNKIKDKDVK